MTEFVVSLIFVVGTAFIVWIIISHLKIKQMIVDFEDNSLRKSLELADKHAAVLISKADNLVYKDNYGNYKFDKFDNEIKYFVETVVMKELIVPKEAVNLYSTHNIRTLKSKIIDEIASYTLGDLRKKVYKGLSFLNISSNIPEDPLQFEAWCRDVFRLFGYEAYLTNRTGDQGADVIAKKDGVTVVVQCKRHQSPVGNSAVQQVAAAKPHYGATSAMVVSTSGFTKSAAQLARTNSVTLLGAYELPGLLEALNANEDSPCDTLKSDLTPAGASPALESLTTGAIKISAQFGSNLPNY